MVYPLGLDPRPYPVNEGGGTPAKEGGGTPAEEVIRRDIENRMRGAEGIEAKRNFPEVFGPPRYGGGSRREIMRRLALRDQKKEWFRPGMNRDIQGPDQMLVPGQKPRYHPYQGPHRLPGELFGQ